MKIFMAVGHMDHEGGPYMYLFLDKAEANKFIALASKNKDEGIYHWEVVEVSTSPDAHSTYKEHRDWIKY